MILKSWVTSVASRLDVGSSRISTRACTSIARAIAIICWTASEYVLSGAATSIDRSRRASSARAWRRISPQRTAPKRRGSRPMKTFSATDRLGRRLISWYTVLTPAAAACIGPVKATCSPPRVTMPASMPYTPVSTLIRVDLPAPFSPISACTSPGRSRKSTPSSARTPGKDLLIAVIVTTGSVIPSDLSGSSVDIGPPHAPGSRRRAAALTTRSVLACRQSGLRLLLGEGGLLGQDALRNRLFGMDLLDQIHQLWAKQRAALGDEVELAVGESLHAVLHGVDGDDLDVLARHLAG